MAVIPAAETARDILVGWARPYPFVFGGVTGADFEE